MNAFCCKKPNHSFMKKVFLLVLTLSFGISFAQKPADAVKSEITTLLDNWHKAAADVKFDAYFSVLAPDAIYIGTDPSENWNVEQFKAFSKPYFDKGQAWSFKAVQRNIYFNTDKNFAYFDELLNTQMKLCRGSGVLRKEKDGKWKIIHYVLSMTIPNKDVDAVVKIKTPFEDEFLKTIYSQGAKNN